MQILLDSAISLWYNIWVIYEFNLGGQYMSDVKKSVLEQVEKNLVKLTLQVEAAEFEAALHQAYLKNRDKLNVPGFRKGKVPRQMIEAQFGKEFFYDDALDFCFSPVYEAALDEHNIDPVSRADVISYEGGKEGATIVVQVWTRPQIEVSDYKGLKYTNRDNKATDDEVMAALEQQRQRNVRITSVSDRPAKNGDTVVIDFEGFMDGVAFDGGKAEGHEITLGSGSFIGNFEEQIEGKNIDEAFEVHVSFPEEYHAEHLAGKPAMFKVTLHDIKEKELPEVDDMFAQEVSEFDTLDEYKTDIGAKIEERKTEQNKAEIEDELANGLAERVTDDIPEAMIEQEVRRLINQFAEMISRQGMNLENYMRMTGQTAESVKQMYQEPAEKNVKGRLAIEAIVRQENITITQEELDAEVDRLAEMYQMSKEKFLEAIGDDGLKSVEADAKGMKAMEMIKEHAIGEDRQEEKDEE